MNLRRQTHRYLLLLVLLIAAPPAFAQETQPGDACATAGHFRVTGGVENPDGHMVFCDGSTWQPILGYSSAGGWVMFGSAGLAAAPLQVWGEVIIGNQGLACTGVTEGAIRYNRTGQIINYCDGAAWQAIGGGALALNELSDAATNTDSICLGQNANGCSSGNNNTILGIAAGSSLSGSNGNVLIGRNAGNGLTTGGRNVIIGYQAGQFITSKSENVIIGHETGQFSTVSRSVLIGKKANRSNSTDESVIIGMEAGENNAGNQNVFIGKKAGRNNGNGSSKNVAIGFLAYGRFSPSGDGYNVAIGHQALLGVGSSTGVRNTAIGARAGDSIGSGSDNILIGYNTDVPDPATNNYINIGDVIYSSGGNVGIGTSSPVTSLDVTGTIKLSYGGEPCDASREGAIHYDSTQDRFLGCTTAGSWIELGSSGAGSGIPSGAVLPFNLSSCPPGWSPLAAAQGRYVVGLPPGGMLAATVGTALSDQENRPVGNHSHTVDPPSASTNTPGHHKHTYVEMDPGGSFLRGPGGDYGLDNNELTGSSGNHSHTVNISAFNSASAGSVAGTNAPYIQLLYCEKD